MFTGKLIEIVPWDEYDPYVLTFQYDVRFGTDQARLAFNPGKDKTRTSNLRPSLILRIIEVESGDWQREVKIEEPEGEKKAGLFNKLLGRSN